MVKLEKVEIEGFGIFKNKQVIDFSGLPANAVVGIFGENNDGDGGYDSNGAGKSTFTNAISWCMFQALPVQGDTTRALKKIDIVNYNSKKAWVAVTFKTGLEYVRLEHSMSAKGTRKIKLFINDEEWEANTDTQRLEKFYSILGIGGKNKNNFIDFLNRCYFSGDVTKSFASKAFSGKDRLNIVSKVKKLEVLDIASANADKEVKNIKSELKTLETKLNLIKENIIENYDFEEKAGEMVHYDTQLSIHRELKDKITKELEKLDERINIHEQLGILQSVLFGHKTNIDNHINSLKTVKEKYEEEFKEIQELRNQIKDLKSLDSEIAEVKEQEKAWNKTKLDEDTKYINIRSKINKLTQDIKHLESEDYLSCPECNSYLILNDDGLIKADYEQAQEILTKLNAELETLIEGKILYEEKIEEINGYLEKLREENKNLITKNANYKTKKDELIKREDKIGKLYPAYTEYIIFHNGEATIKEEVMVYENYEEYSATATQINKWEEELKQYENIEYTVKDLNQVNEEINRIEGLKKDLDTEAKAQVKYREQIKAIDNVAIGLMNDYNNYDYWATSFKKLKNIELIETEPELENITNKILTDLGTGITAHFDVNVDEGELAINLIEDSGNVLPLELFSTGQANRISFAAGLALSEIASNEELNYGFSMWDEVLDGLDNTGQDMFFNVLRTIPELKLVISHDQKLKNYFEHKLVVVRKNHQSNIKLEA